MQIEDKKEDRDAESRVAAVKALATVSVQLLSHGGLKAGGAGLGKGEESGAPAQSSADASTTRAGCITGADVLESSASCAEGRCAVTIFCKSLPNTCLSFI
jgi:hypothetical protein